MPSPWNENPKLRGRFHPEFPDDLQVVVHDGGPHISDRQPELVWVRVTECQDEVFSGVVLNKSFQLQSVAQGSQIQFIVPEGGQYPLQVTPKYLQEKSSWRLLMPCKKCGLTELFDPPSELLASSFPHVSADQLDHGFTFTTQCGWCGGAMVVRLKRTNWPWAEGRNSVGVTDLFKPADLPSDVLEGATLRGTEYGWSIISFPSALERAEAHGHACLGGQFQFRLGDGSTCEMYWLSADSKERLPGESWADYSRRSCSEVKQNFQRLMSETDFSKEASGWNLPPAVIENLVFVAYFVTESELAS